MEVSQLETSAEGEFESIDVLLSLVVIHFHHSLKYNHEKVTIYSGKTHLLGLTAENNNKTSRASRLIIVKSQFWTSRHSENEQNRTKSWFYNHDLSEGRKSGTCQRDVQE